LHNCLATDIPIEDLELLPIFARMVTQAGTASRDSVSLSRKIGTETGGVGAAYHSGIRQQSGVVSDPNDAYLFFVLTGKCVYDKIPNLFDIMEDVLCHARLDNQQRAVEMLKQSRAARESSVISSGHSYAATRLGAQSSPLGLYREKTSGLSYARGLDRLLEQAQTDWEGFSLRLKGIRALILKSYLKSVVVNLTGDEEVIAAATPLAGVFLDKVAVEAIPAGPTDTTTATTTAAGTPFLTGWTGDRLLPKGNEGFIIPSQVNYVVKGGSLFAPGETVRGSFAVAARFLNTGHIWDTVRVMGGAYGGSGSFGAVSGRYLFSSYRDPNVLSTISAYDAAAGALLTASEQVQAEDVLEAVIGAIGDLDSPLSPDQKGYTSMGEFLHGGSAADRQMWRDEVLATSAADFKDFGQRLSTMKESGSVVVFGGRSALETANSNLGEADKLKLEKAFASSSETSPEADQGAGLQDEL
jgi:Zn-dependent M16 (insulinase) family peptidase